VDIFKRQAWKAFRIRLGSVRSFQGLGKYDYRMLKGTEKAVIRRWRPCNSIQPVRLG